MEEDTYSLTASILDYEYENGRRYHAYHAGEYPMPNDEAEQDRLDMMHHNFLLAYDGELYRAPLPERVGAALDIGCGTGIWAIDFADLHTETDVIATDLSAIQPGYVPENLRFEIDDAENQWQFPHKFDYVHIRGMGGAIGDWPKLLQQAYENLNPGGFVEVLDFEAWASTDDNSLPEYSAYHQYQTLLSEASESFGKLMNVSPKFQEYVQAAGFTNVAEDKRKIPLSPWPSDRKQRRMGRYMQMVMLESVEPYALALFTRAMGWNNTMVQAQLAGVRNDLKNMDYHVYTVGHCVWGQKPFT